MQTTVEYRAEKYRAKRPPMKLVWAGCEPLEFTNLFPSWTVKDEVSQLNQKVVFRVYSESQTQLAKSIRSHTIAQR